MALEFGLMMLAVKPKVRKPLSTLLLSSGFWHPSEKLQPQVEFSNSQNPVERLHKKGLHGSMDSSCGFSFVGLGLSVQDAKPKINCHLSKP